MTISSDNPKTDKRQLFSCLGFLAWVLFLPVAQCFAAQASVLDRARIELNAGRISEARKLAQTALQQDPRNPQSHLVLGSVHLLQSRTAEAERSFEFALALAPELRSEVASAYVAAARRFAISAGVERSEALLQEAFEYDPEIRGTAVAALVGDSLGRLRSGDLASRELLVHWLARFPDYVPETEEDIFSLGEYYEGEGQLSKAADLYERCVLEYPEGERGRQAKELIRSRKLVVDRLLSTSCSGRMFITLESIELAFDGTKAALSLVWVSDDRAGRTSKRLRISDESRIETGDGQTFALQTDARRRTRGLDLELHTDTLHHLRLKFPPLPRNQKRVTLLLVNNQCGTSGNWSRRVLRFVDVPLETVTDGASSQESGTLPENEIAVFHVHDYFLVAGRCSGTLSFSPGKISFRSERHGFELPCQDVVRLVQGEKFITEDPLGRIGETGEIPTLLLEGRALNKKGKLKVESWNFLSQDGLPPVLMLKNNLCSSGR